jgi:hypothetical protein
LGGVHAVRNRIEITPRGVLQMAAASAADSPGRRPHRAPRPQVFDTARTTRTLHSGFTPRVDSAQSARIREGRGLGLRDQPTDATTLQLAPHATADLLLPAGRPSPFPAPCRHLVAILPTDLTSSSQIETEHLKVSCRRYSRGVKLQLTVRRACDDALLLALSGYSAARAHDMNL